MTADQLDESEIQRLVNRERLYMEAAQGIYTLMKQNGSNKAALAKALGCSPAYISQILTGEHNFTLEKLADIYLSFGRAVHITLGDDPEEYRLPVDELDGKWEEMQVPDGRMVWKLNGLEIDLVAFGGLAAQQSPSSVKNLISMGGM